MTVFLGSLSVLPFVTTNEAKANQMYCLTVRDVHNNGWADNYFFETLEEANSWSEAMFSLYDSKEGFEGYQWGITKVKLTKVTLNKFMKGYGLHKCGNTPIACPGYTDEDHDYCHKCRS